MLWVFENLERRLTLSVFYNYQVVAKTGDVTTAGDSIDSFVGETSINDNGRVAFVANVTGGNGSGRAVIATPAGTGTPVKISFANPAPARRYDIAQINNDDRVAVNDSISGATLVRTWDANSTGSFSIVSQSGQASPAGGTYDSVQLPSRSEDGNMAYVAFISSSNAAHIFLRGAGHTSLGAISGGGIRLSAGNGGRVAVRDFYNSANAVSVYSTTKPIRRIASADNSFTAVSQPSMSDDGQVVAFAGTQGTNTGVWVSYLDPATADFTAPIQVAGLPNELGFDSAGNAVFLNNFDMSAIGGTLSNRVGVVHRSAGAAGIQDDTILLSFIATSSAASFTNSHTATPLMFSANKGLWTLKLIPELPLFPKGAPAGSVNFDRRTSPMPVVQVGDTIGGNVVTDFTTYDPIATPARDEAGAVRATIDNGDNYVVFRATSAAGEMVVRAAQLDTDSDGLYDHWEKAGSGVDIDLDGTTDLNLNAMGANPMHKDLFLEIDWLAPDAATGTNFAPQAAALTTFINQYANSPLTNPDGVTGVTVHVDAGAGLSQNMGAGSLQGGDKISRSGDGKHIHVIYFGKTDPLAAFPGNTDSIGRPLVSRAMEDIKKNFFSTTDKGAREVAFSYTVFADHYDVTVNGAGAFTGLNNSTGLGEAASFSSANIHSYEPGNDFLVTLQGFRGPASGMLTVPTPVAGAPATIPMPVGFFQSQTLAHELGHTLGLLHGGYDFRTSGAPGAANFNAANYRPTYRSMMSYVYQLHPDTSGVVVSDYSRAADPNYDDWASVTFAFNQYFDTLGGTPAYFSHGGVNDPATVSDSDFTLDDFIATDGPLDASAPVLTIDAPQLNANIATGGNLTVNLTASDNAGIASVDVSFDVNGDGTIAPGETIAATHLNGNNYQAVFNNISGAAGARVITATAADSSTFTSDASRSINITTGAGAPPKLISSSFLYDTLPHKLSFKFDQDVGASLDPTDFSIHKLDGTGPLTPTGITFDSASNTAIVSLPGQIPDGRYVAKLISDGIFSASGKLDGDGDGNPGPDPTFNFLFATADADNDGQIGFTDLVIVAQNYGHTQTTATTGDLNYDGETGFADLVLVAQHYGTALDPPPAAPPVAASPFATAPIAATPVAVKVTSSRAAAPPRKAPATQPKSQSTALPPIFHSPTKRRTAKNWLQSP